MKVKMFSVYDRKIESYMSPFYEHHAGSALRSFEGAVTDPKSTFNKHPDDFVLYEVGTWDDSTGKAEMLEHPNNLGAARLFMPETEQPLQIAKGS